MVREGFVVALLVATGVSSTSMAADLFELTHPELDRREDAAEVALRINEPIEPVAIWLLSNDAEKDLRRAAFIRAVAACHNQTPMCPFLLAYFVGDPDPKTSRQAREALFGLDPATAVTGATRGYKIDKLSVLGARTKSSCSRGCRDALKRLAVDRDLAVRSLAWHVLDRVEP